MQDRAEACSNHDGKLPTALRLIDVAAEAGADAVKLSSSGRASSTRAPPASLVLAITGSEQPADDSDDWEFVDRVEVFIESTRDGSEPSRSLVATASASGAARVIDFEPARWVDLLPYVNEGARMTAEADGEVPPDDVSYDGDATFEVSPL